MTRFTVTGDAAGAVKAVNDLVKAVIKGEEAFEKVSKKADKLDKAAQQITRNNEGPQERYNRKIAELAELVNKGKLSFDQADIAARRYAKQLEEAGTAGKAAFGPAMIGNLASMAAGIASLGTAVSVVTGFFREMEERGTKAAQSTRSSLAQIGALQQLGDSPEQLALMRRVMSEAGIADEGQAANIAFAFNSNAVAGEDRSFLLRAFRGRLLDPGQGDQAVKNLAKARNAMGIDDVETATDELLALSKMTSASLEEVASATTKFGSLAMGAGFDRLESLAAYGVIESGAPSPEEAATQARALFKEIGEGGLKKGSFLETIAAMQYDDLSSIEAKQAFNTLRSGQAMFGNVMATVSTADATNFATQQMNEAATDPMFGAALRAAQAEAAAAVANSQYGVAENLLDAINSDREVISARSGNQAAAYLRSMVVRGLDFFGQDDSVIRGAAYDENLPAETRLQAARYLRQNFEPGMFQTQGSIDAVTQRLDAMIANLEQMVRASNTQANGVTTRQE